MFDMHIYGTPSRDNFIIPLSSALDIPPQNIHYDDRPNGGPILYMSKKAWLADIPPDITHRIVFQDDVEVCHNFVDIALQIAANHPKDIISFFPFNFQRSNPKIEGLDTPYFIAATLSCPAVMMPVEYIEPCFHYIDTRFGENVDDDWAIQEWARHAGVRILTTIPAIVQHIGDVSVANKMAPVRRTVYYDSNPQANWDSKKVMNWRVDEWFFSNHGKITSGGKGVLEVASTEG